MNNFTGSIHRLFPGRIKENFEYVLDANGNVKKYPSNGEQLQHGVSSFVPPAFPHLLPFIDGICHSCLPVGLTNAGIGQIPDGVICLLVRSGETKHRKKAKLIDYANAVDCPHFLLFQLDTHETNFDADGFSEFIQDVSLWTICTEFKAASTSDKICDDNDDNDHNWNGEDLETNLKHLSFLLIAYINENLNQKECLFDVNDVNDMEEVCAFLCIKRPTLAEFFANSIRRCNFVFNLLCRLPDLESDRIEMYRSSLLFCFAHNAKLWNKSERFEPFNMIKKSDEKRVRI